MVVWKEKLAIFVIFYSMIAQQAMAQDRQLDPIIDRPASYVWDRDSLFRNDPEVLGKISKILEDLEEKEGMEIYLVLYSSTIGEKLEPFARRCHDAWLGEESDGLVFGLSLNGRLSGTLERSHKLYEGQLIEQGIMPRVSLSNLQTIMRQAILEVQREEDEIDQVHLFTRFFTGKIRERLAITKEADKSRESYHFMGWMALALLVCGVLMSLTSKLVVAAERRSTKTFLFPDFVVPQRLRAPYGGGKISVVDY